MKDRNIPSDVALISARHFMMGEQEHNRSANSHLELYGDHPPRYWSDQFPLFRNRPLYPWLSALLFPLLGPMALKAVSAAAYVFTVVVMYFVLLTITSPAGSTFGTLIFATQQVVLDTSTLALTDQLALLFWTCVLGATMAFERRPSTLTWTVICCASIALTLTRPAFFLPLGAAFGAYWSMRRSFNLAVALAPVVAGIPAVIMYLAYGAVVHGPSFIDQLNWQYTTQRSLHGFGTDSGQVIWYIAAIGRGIADIVVLGGRELGGLTLVLIAGFGAMRASRSNGAAWIAIMSGAVSMIALFVNPIEVERPLILPLAPVVVILAALGLARTSTAKL